MSVAIMNTDLDQSEVVGIWNDSDLFTKYQVGITFIDKVMGGVPQKPEAIEGWLRQRIVGGDGEVKAMIARTMEELGIDASEGTSMNDAYVAAKHIAAEQHGNTFRRDENGLYLADYQIKAALKECTNILYAGERWGVTKKGPKSFLAERVFVDEKRIYLGRNEPDGMDLQIGHVTGPRGPRSTLTYYDYCYRPSVSFTLSSLRKFVEPMLLQEILMTMEKGGLGALRSMGHGQFKVTSFEQL